MSIVHHLWCAWPSQSNVDFSVAKRFPLAESKDFQFQADFFNVLNHAHPDNPIGEVSTSDFGKILSFSASPRIMQFSLKFNFWLLKRRDHGSIQAMSLPP